MVAVGRLITKSAPHKIKKLLLKRWQAPFHVHVLFKDTISLRVRVVKPDQDPAAQLQRLVTTPSQMSQEQTRPLQTPSSILGEDHGVLKFQMTLAAIGLPAKSFAPAVIVTV